MALTEPGNPAVARLRDRDFTSEVEALYRADGARLWRAIYAYSASRAVTDDAVAEGFAQLLRRGDEVRDPKAWVWRAAFRLAAGDLQRQRQTVNELVLDIALDAPEDTVDLVAALADVSEMQRKALVLHDYAGFRAAEVAAMTGSTEAAVRVHLVRGRRRLRDRLG